MPGYIAEVRRQIELGLSVDELIHDVSGGFEALLLKEFKKIQLNEELEKILGVLAFGPEQYTLIELGDITKVEPKEIIASIDKISYIKIDEKNKCVLINVYRTLPKVA